MSAPINVDPLLVIQSLRQQLAETAEQAATYWAGMQQLAQQLGEAGEQIKRMTERLQDQPGEISPDQPVT